MKKIFVGIALAAALGVSAAPKVLIYMLDGARADVMEATDTPAPVETPEATDTPAPTEAPATGDLFKYEDGFIVGGGK